MSTRRSRNAKRYHLAADEHADFRDSSICLIDDVELDLTGYTARLEIKREHFNNQPLILMSTENGEITLGQGSPGEIKLSLTAERLSKLQPLYYRDSKGYSDFEQDLFLVEPGGFRRKYWAGRFRVYESVTKVPPTSGA